MRILSTGMKWKNLEIKKDQKGFPEIHYTSVFRAFQGWVNDGIGAQIDILIKILQDCFSSIIFILKFGYHGISHSKERYKSL